MRRNDIRNIRVVLLVLREKSLVHQLLFKEGALRYYGTIDFFDAFGRAVANLEILLCSNWMEHIFLFL